VKQHRGISADTAARPARHFGGDAASWLALQARYDLETLLRRDEIERRVTVRDREAV
jgi:antitoxin HigA-1